MRKHPVAVLTGAVTQLLDDAGRIPVTSLSGGELDAVIEEALAAISRLTVHLTAAVEQAGAIDTTTTDPTRPPETDRLPHDSTPASPTS